MNIPNDRSYTEAHEWALSTGDSTVRVGISDFAQDALGDIVYADLPDVGATVSKGDTIAEIESTKSVGEVYAPASGTVTAVNDALDDAPELVNSDPYGEGWIVELELSEPLGDMLDAAGYEALVTTD